MGEVGKTGPVGRTGRDSGKLRTGPAPVTTRGVVVAAGGAKYEVALTKTELGEGAFSFEIVTAAAAAKSDRVTIRQAADVGITSLSVIPADTTPTEVYSGPALYDALKKEQDGPAGMRERLKLVGTRPAAGDLGTVTRVKNGDKLTVTFSPAKDRAVGRVRTLLASAGAVIEPANAKNFEEAYCGVQRMIAALPWKQWE